jgi:hypothetical protein
MYMCMCSSTVCTLNTGDVIVISLFLYTQEVVLSPEHDEFYREVSPWQLGYIINYKLSSSKRNTCTCCTVIIVIFQASYT